MLIIITDLCGSTNYAEKNKENMKLIRSLYQNSIALQVKLLEKSGLPCKIIKSTGDGLLITASANENEEQKLTEWIKIIKRLSVEFANNSGVLPIRIVAHFCNEEKLKVITNLELTKLKDIRAIENISTFEIVLKADIFGPQVNMLFRLSQAVIGNYIVITNDLVRYLVKGTEHHEQFIRREVINLDEVKIGPPIPLTYFKGIDSIGFANNNSITFARESSSETNRMEPFWVWEVS